MPAETPTPSDTTQLAWDPGAATVLRMHRSGLRLTHARRAVLRALHDNRDCFLDAEAVHRSTRMATWRVNLTTVYRILGELGRAHVAQTSRIGSRVFYSWMPEDEDAESHFVCRRCKKAQTLGTDALFTQLFDKAAELGFHLDKRLTFLGLCSACKAIAPRSRRRADLPDDTPTTPARSAPASQT